MPNDEQPEIVLVVNGEQYPGWKTSAFRWSIQEIAPTFSVGYAEKWAPHKEAEPIQEGDAVEVRIVGGLSNLNKTVLTGWVDDFNATYTKSSHSLSVVGRSRTCDLVDCSSVVTGQMRDKTLLAIAADLCEPFRIRVSVGDEALRSDEAFMEPIPRFKVEVGETPFEALTRLTRKRGVLMMADALGDLVLTRASKTPLSTVQIRRGENVLAGGFSGSQRERFSEYRFKGQTAGTDDWNGASAAQIKNVVNDANVERFRPMTILAEHQGTPEDLGRRAIWERNTRAARSENLNYTVRGWTHIHGLWTPNTVVPVVDDWLRFEDDMLISGVSIDRTLEQGRVAQIELTGREAFDIYEPPPKRKKRRRGRRRNLAGL